LAQFRQQLVNFILWQFQGAPLSFDRGLGAARGSAFSHGRENTSCRGLDDHARAIFCSNVWHIAVHGEWYLVTAFGPQAGNLRERLPMELVS
jgi:hypothetical protein